MTRAFDEPNPKATGEQIRVLIKRISDPVCTEWIGSELESQQKIVGGFVEYLPLFIDEEGTVEACFNENGRLSRLGFNMMLKNNRGEFDVVGDLFFCRVDRKGETVSLTDADITTLLKQYFVGQVAVGDGKHRRTT